MEILIDEKLYVKTAFSLPYLLSHIRQKKFPGGIRGEYKW
jgi:hypothetical protein